MEADQLYGLPLERFVSERDALAKTLRAAGDREQAVRVSKLRKPSVAAWAVNQLMRTQRGAVAELFAAGDELARAHAAVLAGEGDGRSLRDAAGRERAAVEALIGAARGLLSGDGHDLSPAVIDRVSDTLHAAALDDQAREQVREGRLERELRHVGLGAGGFAGGEPRRKAEPSPRRDEELAAARRSARAAEADARRRLERAHRALEAATTTKDRAEQQLRAAEEALDHAALEARAAEQAHREAAEQVERIAR